MLPLLFDEGLPHQVAEAMRSVGLDAHAVGGDPAPPRKSPDSANVEWCEERGVVLITNDRGKKDRIILDLLAQHRVHAIFVHDDLRAAEAHHLLFALLKAEKHMGDLAASGKLIRHRIKPTGRLERRGA